ncbi:MAG: hypothetical protein M3247_04060, partial [Thermoproteota archaeon]|nr:hypothetical protein [Thermoproteota archaeon]
FYAREFYEHLLSMPIDQNIQAVRKLIRNDSRVEPKDFSIPVLFMNGSDGVIFSASDDNRIEPRWANRFLAEYFSLISDEGIMDQLVRDMEHYSNKLIEISNNRQKRRKQPKEIPMNLLRQKGTLYKIKQDLKISQKLNDLCPGDQMKIRISTMADDIEEFLKLYEENGGDDFEQLIQRTQKINISHRNLYDNVKRLYYDVINGCIKV